MKILVINGVNLNMLGQRDASKYGNMTLEELNLNITRKFSQDDVTIDFVQSNYEGQVVEFLQNAKQSYYGIVINPGAFTHYSYAIRDAIECAGLPVVEVHLSDIYNRESFRKISVIEDVCCARFYGEKETSYYKAINLLIKKHKENEKWLSY